jgi:hypothetical protein
LPNYYFGVTTPLARIISHHKAVSGSDKHFSYFLLSLHLFCLRLLDVPSHCR